MSRDDLNSPSAARLSTIFAEGSELARVDAVSGDLCAGLSAAFRSSPTETTLSHGASLRLHTLSTGPVLLGNASTNPSKNQPTTIPLDILGSFLSILPAKEVKDQNITLPHGTPFKATDHPLLAPLQLNGRQNHVVLLCPAGLPTKFGIEGVLTGPISQDMFNLVDLQHGDFGSSYLAVVSSHRTEISTLLVAHRDELSAILPKIPSGIKLISDPFLKFDLVEPTLQEGALQSECEALTERLQVYLSSPAASTSNVPVLTVNPPGGDVSVIGGGDASVTASQTRQVDETSRLLALHGALHGRVVLDSNGLPVFQPAILTSAAIAALSHSKKSIILSAVRSLFVAVQKSYQQPPLRRDIVCSQVNFTILADDLPVGWLAHAKHSTNMDRFTSITDMQNHRASYTPLCNLPDRRQASHQRQKHAAAKSARANEEMLGQGAEHLTKVSTDIVISSAIPSIASIFALLSHYTLISNAFVDFNPTTNPSTSPPFHNMSYQLCEIINSPDFTEWYDDLDDTDRHSFLHWLLSRTTVIAQKIGALPTVEDTITAIQDGTPELVNVQPYITIDNLVTQTVGAISSMIDGTSSAIPSCTFFTSSRYYKEAEEKKNHQIISDYLKRAGLSTPGKEAKRQRQHLITPSADLKSSPSPSATLPRKEGEIIWSVQGRKVPVPPRIPGVTSLCLMHILHDSQGCPRRGTCQFHHPDGLSQWDSSLVDAWDAQVKATEGLSWHPTLGKKV